MLGLCSLGERKEEAKTNVDMLAYRWCHALRPRPNLPNLDATCMALRRPAIPP